MEQSLILPWRELLLGLCSGLLVATWIARGERSRPGEAPSWGTPLMAAALLAWGLAGVATWGLLVGLGLLVAAGLRGSTPRGGGPRAALALASVLCVTLGGGIPWALKEHLLLAAGMLLAGVLLADFDRRHRDGSALAPFLAISIAGLCLAIPDTEGAFALAGAGLPLLLLWLRRGGPLGAPGGIAVATGFLWSAAAGSGGRPGALLAGALSLGLPLLEPLGQILLPHPARGRQELSLPGIAAHALFVAVVSRLVPRQSAPEQSAAVAGLAVAALLVAGGAVRLWRILRARAAGG